MKPQDEYVSALLLFSPYWDKPASELPENLRAIASLLWDALTPEGRQDWARQYDGSHDPARRWLWYDTSMDARTWWGLQDIKPRDAAMLLCRINPLCKHEDPESIYVDDDRSSPKRYLRLLLMFEDVANAAPQTRTLPQWLGIAREKQLKYHPWIDEYERGITETPAAPGMSEGSAPTKDWMVQARMIADECFNNDTAAGCRDSLKGYSRRVMERGIKGPRGIIDNSATIMRDALQGGKWWRKKSK